MTPEQLRPQHDLAGDQTAEDHDVIQDTTAGPPRVDRASQGWARPAWAAPNCSGGPLAPASPAGAALGANVARPLPMPPG